MALATITISNHPVLGYERELEICGNHTDDKTKTYLQYYEINHFKDGSPVSITIPEKPWVVDNSYLAIVRDPDNNFEPVPNPDYEPEYEVTGYTEQPVDWNEEEDGVFEPEPIYGGTIVNEDDQWLRMPAYDFFKSLTYDREIPVSIPLLMIYYTLDEDAKGRFDFY